MRFLWVIVAVGCHEAPTAPAPSAPPAPSPIAIAKPMPSKAAVTKLSVGSQHTCALHEDGTLSCWGVNTNSQLGVENLERSLVPMVVPGVTGAIDVEAVDDMTCIRHADKTAVCWGFLGAQSIVKAPAQLLEGVEQISGRCFRMTGGTIQCLTGQAQLVPIDGVDDAIEMASWGPHGCFVRADHTVKCWVADKLLEVKGLTLVDHVVTNAHSACAQSSSSAITCWALTDQVLMLNTTGSTFKQSAGVVAGRDQTCVRTADNIECWSGYSAPTKKLDVPPSAPLALGDHSCVGKGGREVACWGSATEGELGNGWWRRRPVPTEVPGVENVVELASAMRGQSMCARSSDGTASCWGTTIKGPIAKPEPIDVKNVAAIVNAEVMRAIDDKHRLWSRDYNNYESDYAPVVSESNVEKASDQCFINTKGRVKCWRGYMEADPRDPKYALIPKISDAIAISSFSDQGVACAIHRTGKLTCFHKGSDVANEISVEDVIAVSVSEYAQCAIRSDHSLWCWGSTVSPIFPPRLEPIDLPPTRVPVGEVTAVSLGRDMICVVKTSGAVACWGANSEGQLGDGTFMPRTQAAEVIGITDAVAVQVGMNFACAAHKTGKVSCWGSTDRGQVGTMATYNVDTPQPVAWP